MRHTPLYEAHVRLGAKIVDFGGWAMPVSYSSGILEEHRATRAAELLVAYLEGDVSAKP